MNQNADKQLLLAVPDIARTLKCSERFIWQEIQRGKLARVRIGRLVRVPVEEVERYVSERTTPGFDAKEIAAKILKRRN